MAGPERKLRTYQGHSGVIDHQLTWEYFGHIHHACLATQVETTGSSVTQAADESEEHIGRCLKSKLLPHEPETFWRTHRPDHILTQDINR